MKMMLGACFFACAKRSRTRAAPTPTNISTNSDAVSEKNVAPDSPATARAKSVLPHPGGPVSMTPFGTFAPEVLNFSGLRKKSTISASSILASPMPATSANLTISLSSRIFIFERSFPCLRSSFFLSASASARSSIAAISAAVAPATVADKPVRSFVVVSCEASFLAAFSSSSSFARRAAAIASATASAGSPSAPSATSRFPITFMPPTFMNPETASSPLVPPAAPPPGPPPSSETAKRARAWSLARSTSSSVSTFS